MPIVWWYSKGIKSKQKIPTATLDLIGKYSSTAYQSCYAYNLALENLQLARQEQALNFVSNIQELFNNYAEINLNIIKQWLQEH